MRSRSHGQGRWTRREVLKLAGAGTAYAAAGGLGTLVARDGALAASRPIHLNFTVWSYSVDTIQDNIKRFEAEAKRTVTVTVTDIPWNNYHETMVSRLSGKAPIHVLYNGGDWLPEFARAGWVVPLEDYFPKARSYYARKIVGTPCRT